MMSIAEASAPGRNNPPSNGIGSQAKPPRLIPLAHDRLPRNIFPSDIHLLRSVSTQSATQTSEAGLNRSQEDSETAETQDEDEEGGPRLEDMAWFTIRDDGGSSPTGTGVNQRQRRLPNSKQRRDALIQSYLLDWVLMIVLAAVFFSLDAVPGFKREFSIDDPTLHFPYAVHERVPPVALYFIAIVAPFVLQIGVNLITIRSWWDFHTGSLGLLFGLALTGAITQFTKITVGRPRPDVISRCQPVSDVTDPEYGLVSVAICTQTDNAILKDGWRSFPSGHSSLSFAGLGFLSFYLAGKLHLFDEKGHTTKAWLALTPLSGAALVAISRTMDYRHHWQDVLVGSALGLAMSYFAYRQYYPSLASERSDRPFSPRIKRGERDEETGRGLRDDETILTSRIPSQRSRSEGTLHLGSNGRAYPIYQDEEEGERNGEGITRTSNGGREHARGASEDVELMTST